MAQDNTRNLMDDGTMQSFAVFTLLPFPLLFLLGVLIVVALLVTPNSGYAPGWIGSALEAIYCMPYLGSGLLAIIGIILSFTAWKTPRTLWINILIWINAILLGVQVLAACYLYYAITYTDFLHFTF